MTKQRTCFFFHDNLSNNNLETIKAHLLTCSHCLKEVQDSFEDYLKWGHLPGTLLKLPQGIKELEDFLKAWHFCSCSMEEKSATIVDELIRKQNQPEIDQVMGALRFWQTRVALEGILKGYSILNEQTREGVVRKLKKLHSLLGQRVFVYYMTGECEGYDTLLEDLILFWRKAKKVDSQ